MCQAFGLIGSFIIDIIVLIVCMVLITERSALRGMQKGGKKVYESAKESNEKYREYREYRAQERKERRMDHKVSGVSIDTRIEEKGKKNKKRKSDEMGELSAPAFDMMPDTTVSPMPEKISSPAPVAVLEEPAAEIQPEISGDFMPDTFPPEPSQAAPVPEHIAGLAPAKDVLKPAEKTQKKKNKQEIQNEVQKVAQEMETSGLEHKPDKAYVFPSIDLLKKGEGKKSANTEHQLRETADKLQQTLKNFGVNVTVTNISCGPAVTRYEIQPEMGVKVSKIVGLTDDIKLNLAAADIRIELSVYNGIPHLMIPVVTDPKKASGALHWAVAEMTERYEKFAEANVREINGYNAKVDSIEVPEGQERPQKMPQIVIIVDELADLMMVASNDVEEAICRLAQLARAAGIHLVIATQRPSVNVITGLIKANMPSRIAFSVTSGTDSRTILDMNGAEKLLGKGDMLFHPQGAPKPIRVQGAFVSDKEVSDVVEFIKEQNETASYNEEIVQKVDSMQASSGGTTVSISDADAQDDGRDAYFDEAAQIIVDKEKASIGMLQRYLKVGFNRAARIMDQLEEAGIVGPEEGTKPRKVLMTSEELQAVKEDL